MLDSTMCHIVIIEYVSTNKTRYTENKAIDKHHKSIRNRLLMEHLQILKLMSKKQKTCFNKYF
jgi:hypothetical protein